MEPWLIWISCASLGLAVGCAAVMVADLATGHRQKMWIMNIVWPITALYSGPLGLWAYFTVGRRSSQAAWHTATKQHQKPPAQEKPLWQAVGVAASHCGAGCALADIVTAGSLVAVPMTLFGREIFAEWAVSYVLALTIGIAFQYFTIAPMRNLSVGAGLWAALKADTLSLTAWQVGMYGWMALANFVIFGHELNKGSSVYWFMMQLAMFAGFVTAYPINWWLVRNGVKERM
ncbi:MAG: DUF4396 domain-containing protein [Candidatus Dormibacteraeota bacterium]|nr:DUF4396 domain-containing protein [Candidatus Dormibacteraeota bacterium]